MKQEIVIEFMTRIEHGDEAHRAWLRKECAPLIEQIIDEAEARGAASQSERILTVSVQLGRARALFRAESLFLKIGHGDADHRGWLKQELSEWFDSRWRRVLGESRHVSPPTEELNRGPAADASSVAVQGQTESECVAGHSKNIYMKCMLPLTHNGPCEFEECPEPESGE